MAINRGGIIEFKDIKYTPRGYYSILAPGETQTFSLEQFSAFVLVGTGNGDNQLGIFYVTYENIYKISGAGGIQITAQPAAHGFTVHNNFDWYIDYTVLRAVTSVE